MRPALIGCVVAALAGTASAGVLVTASDPAADDVSRRQEIATLAAHLPASDSELRVDISVADLKIDIGDDVIALVAEVHVAVCDEHGTIRSIVSGGARLEIPASQYRAKRLSLLRRDVVTAALDGVANKVAAQLPRTPAVPAWMTRWLDWFMQNRAVARFDTRPSS
jgi:hypothetical protein